MAKHDIVTYNPTTQGFETDLQDNTAQIKGEGNKIFSVESGSTTLFSIGADNQSISINTNLTASGDISSSVGSTGSFSVLEFTKISGDASQLTFVNETNHVSGAAQVASRISGAFDSGFEILGDLSGSVGSSGSFGKVFANHYVGDASLMTNVNEEGHFSSSAQLSSNISGSFNKGFEFDGTISGSAQSTGSFGNLIWDGQITGDASTVTNLNENEFISSSAQLSSEISSSFQRGFVLEGTISGSMASTASFHVISASTYVVTNPVLLNTPLQQIEGIISGAIQLENNIGDSPISGAFDQGFEFTSGDISGSAQSTGSFTRLDSTTLSGDATLITDLSFPDGTVSSSAQIATSISGSFTSGFKFTGEISGSGISTGSFGQVWSDKYIGDFSAVDAPEDGYISGSGQIASYISGSWNSGIKFGNNVGTSSYWAGVSGSAFHYARNATTMSISSICGSDFDYRLYEKSDLRGYRGITHPYGGESNQYGANYAVWSVTSALITARSNSFQFGSAEAALAAGGYAPTPSDISEKFDGTVWASSATLAEVRVTGGSAGTQNAALIFGGRVTHPAESDTDRTEQYNGSTWSEVNNMSVAANGVGGLGTQNAAVVAGPMGSPAAAQVEQWNGNVWSEAASHNVNRSSFGMGGSYDAGMMAGGSPTCTCSELWNGTTWTATSGIPNGQRDVTFIGSSNAGFLTGGHAQVNGGHSSDVWDGTVWYNGPNLNQSRGQSGKSGVGLSSNGLMVGGAQNTNPAGVILSCTENITVGFVNTGSWYMACADSISVDDFSDSTYTFETASIAGTALANTVSGSFNKGFEVDGNISGSVTSTASLSNFKADTVVTSEMTIGSDFINSNISSSFTTHITKPHIIPSVGDKYFDTRQYMSTGSGQLFSSGSCAEFSNGYDGADGQLSIGVDGILNISFQTSSFNQAVIPGAWSSGPDTITIAMASAVGTQNSSLFISGKDLNGGNTPTLHTQHYNGVSWRLGGNTLEDKGAQVQGQAFGIQNSAQAGPSRGAGNKTKEMQYNGVNWYIVQSMQTNRCMTGAAGTTDAGLRFGKGDSPYTGITEEWNGHSWSEVNAMADGREGALGGGTQNAGITGGGVGSNTATELYDGTSWSEGSAHTVSAGGKDGASGGTQNNFSINLNLDKSETFNGSTWSVNPTLTIDRYQPGFAGQGSLGMVMGGSNASGNSATKDTLEWNGSFASGSFLKTKKIGATSPTIV